LTFFKRNFNLYKILKAAKWKNTTLILLFFGLLTIKSQTATSITSLQTPALDENSGLLFYNGTINYHHDSGNKALVYEIDASTGIMNKNELR
jgi:hypothetical protein